MAFRFILFRHLGLSLTIAIFLSVMATLGGFFEPETVPGALFWGGVFAVPGTWWDLQKRALWPFFDNLRVRRWAPLAVGTSIMALFAWAAGALF